MDKKFCLHCGAELEPEAVFCQRCGTAVTAQPAAGPTPIEQYNMNIKPKVKLTDKIDIKKTVLNNIIPVSCLVIGIILVICGLSVGVPSDYISSYDMWEYVGGDAYNYIIEAALRAGRISGAETSKSVYIAVGLLIACMSALKINIVKPAKEEK